MLQTEKLIKNTNKILTGKPVLFCFPFAGGGASAYSRWEKALGGEIVVCPIQLPGREDRMLDRPYLDMEDLLHDLQKAIWPVLTDHTYFWGHSMGAKLAFELAARLEKEHFGVNHLLVSGSRAPCFPELHPIYHLPDEDFEKELSRFEGTPKEIMANKELLKFFVPMLRADFTLDETYYSDRHTQLNCSITALGGTQDREAGLKEILEWEKLTTGAFRYRLFEGGHFFIREKEQEVLAEVRTAIGNTTK